MPDPEPKKITVDTAEKGKDLRRRPPEVGGETSDSDRLVTRVEAETAAVEQQAERLLAQVERDVVSGLDVDGGKTAQALRKVLQDVNSLRFRFMQRLREILAMPGELIKEVKETLLLKELYVPDNPKIMNRILREVSSGSVPIKASIKLYKRAHKRNEWAWREVERALDDGVVKAISAEFARGQSTKALELYDLLSEPRQRTESKDVTNQIVQAEIAQLPASQQEDLMSFIVRRAAFDQASHRIQTSIAFRDDLRYAYNNNHRDLPAQLFTASEQFLLGQPVAAIEKLASFPAAEQRSIITYWTANAESHWGDILVDPEAERLVPIVLEFPQAKRYYHQTDKKTVLYLEEKFSPAQRSAAWEKAGPPPEVTWEVVKMFVLMGSSEKSTPEQLRQLDATSAQVIALSMEADGEEALVQMWNDDTLQDLAEMRDRLSQGYGWRSITPEGLTFKLQRLPDAVRRHLPQESGGGSGWPSATRPGRTVWEHHGFQGVAGRVENFFRGVEAVPERYREQVFTVLKPKKYGYHFGDIGWIRESQAEHFLEFVELAGAQGQVTLEALCQQRDRFDSPRWEQLREGVVVARESGLPMLLESEMTAGHLDMYEQASHPEQAQVNRFIKESAEQSVTLFQRESGTHDQYERRPRNPETVNDLYFLNQAARKYFSQDAEAVGEFLCLKPRDVQVIKGLLDGTLVEASRGRIDRAVVEGVGKDAGRIMRHLDDQTKKHLERFVALSSEQKARWNYLYEKVLWLGGRQDEANADQLFELAASPEGAAMVQFLEGNKIIRLHSETALIMARRPDCVGLFYYVTNEISSVGQKDLAERLILLQDAGLPSIYALSGYAGTTAFKYQEVEKLKKCELGRLARLAQHMAQVSAELTLVELIGVVGEVEESEESRGSEEQIKDRITKAGAYLDGYIDRTPPFPGEIETLNLRLETTHTSVGIECDQKQRRQLMAMSVKVWDRLSAKPQILREYLLSGSYSIREEALKLSDEVLADSMIWKYKVPDALWGDPVAMETLGRLIPMLEAYHPKMLRNDYGGDLRLAELVKVYLKAPWLFSETSLRVFESPNDQVLPIFSDLNEEEWDRVRAQVGCFRFDRRDGAMEFLAEWKTGRMVLPSAVIEQLRTSLRRIPWVEAKDIAEQLQRGTDLKTISQEKDQTDEAAHGRGEWYAERAVFLQAKSRETYPAFSLPVELRLKDWEILSQASAATLKRIQLLYEKNHMLKYDRSYFSQYVYIAEHPNYQRIAQVFELEGFDTGHLLGRDNAEVTQFLDGVTQEVIAGLQAWPKPVQMQVVDAVLFFADPRASELLELARQLQAQFGMAETFSIYDLLLFNDQDIARVRQLSAETFFPVTKENLKALGRTADGEVRGTIQKLLSSFDHRYPIDIEAALNDLKSLSPELRVAVLKAKTSENFGWSILKHRETILGELGVSQDDFDELIRSVYRSQAREMPFCDLPMAQALLNDPYRLSETDRVERVKEIIPKFSGELATLFQVARVSGSIDPLVQEVVRRQFKDFVEQQKGVSDLSLTDENWIQVVLAYVRTTIEDFELPKADQKISDSAVELFKRPEAKDFASTRLAQLWQAQLAGEHPEVMDFDLSVVSNFVKQCGGAGPMSQFEALALFVDTFGTVVGNPATVERTRTEVVGGLRAMENRFTRERWSNDDRADFYNISRDILQATPSLFAEFMETFKQLQPKDMKRFAEEVYPLFRAQLAVTGRASKTEGQPRQYNPDDLMKVQETVQGFAQAGKGDVGRFDRLKKELITDIGQRFKERFGIARIPEEFTPEHIRSLSNITLYLANMANRTHGKEKTLGLYLSLLINNKWDSFRRGEVIEAGEYLTEVEAGEISELLKRRAELNPLTPERLNIPAADMAEFQLLLQRESPAIAVGAVETIDVKLTNVITNLRRLEDPDLYPDQMDQQRMELLLEFGNKRVGAVAAKFYLEHTPAGPQVAFSAEEAEVKERMVRMLQVAGIPQTAEAIKGVFQEAMKPLAALVNVVKFVEEVKAEDDIEHLRGLLHPTEGVVKVFNRLGEEFKPTSGALALSQDLDYLDNIIVKREDELTPEEVRILQEYVGRIREQVVKLQATYDQIKAKFSAVRASMGAVRSELLRAKLAEIEKIISTESAQLAVTSNMTHNLNSIIENIRECLSCVRQGCNNDTDLTFGDSNKFFVYSHTAEQRKGSIADQIVFLEPVSMGGQEPEMSFVLDRVYGNCTPFILNNHIAAVFKKYKTIKQRFPEAKLSILVTAAAISTAGTTPEMLRESLKTQFGPEVKVERVESEVDVVESATGAHYVEFGGGTRVSGKRPVNGLSISL